MLSETATVSQESPVTCLPLVVGTLTPSTETTVDLFIFGTAEPATAIMAASMPILRIMFLRRGSSPAGLVQMRQDGKLAAKSTQKLNDPEVVSL